MVEQPHGEPVCLARVRKRNRSQQLQPGHQESQHPGPNTRGPENGDPEKLLDAYKKLRQEVAQTRDALKKELMDALGGTAA